VKIVHVISSLENGGAELMLKRLILSHRENINFSHSVVSLTTLGPIGSDLIRLGVDVNVLDMRNIFDFHKVFFSLIKFIRCGDFDIVQTWMYHADFFGGVAAFLAGNRNIIWGVRTTKLNKFSSSFFLRFICIFLSYFIPKVIVCAANSALKFHASLGYNKARLTFVPNGFDLSRFVFKVTDRNRIRSTFHFQDDDIVILSLGRFTYEKDHANFISAAGIVSSKYKNVKFLLVGRGVNESNQSLTSLISQTGFHQNFFLVGESDNVPAIFAAVDIFCLHSRTEAFPNVLGEAMAMGLPCISTAVGDAELILGDCGSVVPKMNSSALALSIMNFIELPYHKKLNLGECSKARVSNLFSMNSTKQCFEKIYKNIVLQDS